MFQGHCGSCWAFGAVEALSDRFCIHFGMVTELSYRKQIALSWTILMHILFFFWLGGILFPIWFIAEHISLCQWSRSMLWLYVWLWLWWGVSNLCMAIFCPPWCCHWRGNKSLSLSLSQFCTIKLLCYIGVAFLFFLGRVCLMNTFIIWQCDPYFDDIGCSHPGCEPAYPTPKCVRKCVNKNQLWRNSKHYGVSAYRISSDPDSIMAEIYKNGPVEVAFTVYEVIESFLAWFMLL